MASKDHIIDELVPSVSAGDQAKQPWQTPELLALGNANDVMVSVGPGGEAGSKS
jgi:hypothetical protein